MRFHRRVELGVGEGRRGLEQAYGWEALSFKCPSSHGFLKTQVGTIEAAEAP